MSSLTDIIRGLSGSALLVLLNVVWQCGAIFLVGYAAIKLCRPRSPLTRHLVWLLALVGMAACPIIAATTHAGSLQLVQLPLAIDSARHAAQPPAGDLAGEQDAVEPDAATAARPRERDGASRGEVTGPFTGSSTAETTEPGNLDDESHRRAAAGLEDHRGERLNHTAAGSTQSGQASRLSWQAIAVMVWAGGFLVLILRFFVAQFAVWRLVRRSVPARDTWLLRAFASAKAMVGTRRRVALRISSELAVPVATGVLRPCVLFPERLVEQLAGADLQAIAVHELTHVKRLDPAVMVLERLVQAVLFFHPAVWLASRALSAAREELCDEAVVRATAKPVAYAKCLTSLFEQVRVLSRCRVASVGIAHYRSKLFQRVETLLSGRMLLLHRLPHGLKAVAIGAACIALALIGGISFVRAQATDDTEAGADTADTQPNADHDPDDGATDVIVSEPKEPYRWVNEGGPFGGEVCSLTLSAAKPNVLYVATNDELHRSTDGAETWTRMEPPPVNDGGGPRLRTLLADPEDPDTLYAYTNTSIKSTDGGITWARMFSTQTWHGVRQFAVSTGETRALYALRWERSVGMFDDHSVMRSVDGGRTWAKCLDYSSIRAVCQLLADPNAPGTLYTVSPLRRAIFSSSDGGATWRQTAGRLTGVSVKAYERVDDDPKHVKVEFLYDDGTSAFETTTAGLWWKGSRGPRMLHAGALDRDPDDPKKLQLTVDSEEHGEVLMTRDEGKTWTVLDLPWSTYKLQAVGFSATQPDVLYAGSTDGNYVFSADSGETWEHFYSVSGDPRREQTAEIDELAAAFPCLFRTNRPYFLAPIVNPRDPSIGYGSNGMGVEKTVDGGVTWVDANNGLSTILILDIAADPKTPGLVYAAGAGGVYKSEDSAKTWRLVCGSQECRRPRGFPLSESPDKACCIVAVNPLAPDIVLTAGRRIGAGISFDAGETWRGIPAIPRDANILSFYFDPNDAKRFYMLNAAKMWETTDAGRTWQVRTTWDAVEFKLPHEYFWGIIPRGDASTIYRIDTDKKLVRSTDLGETWELLDLPASQGDIIAEADPGNPKAVIVRDEDKGLFLSTDAGDTWSSVTPPWQPNCIALHPGDPNTLYIAHHRKGVLRTRDGGKTFERFSKGLPGKSITCVAVSPVDGTIYAGTWAAGVYRLETGKAASELQR